ncbi:PREDICTED: probable E3 ubiquitin-protein ligase RNF217, partial [Nicotiana attenuata]
CESAVLGLAQCYCPNQNCSALILDECGGNAKQSKCPNCKKLFCFKCKIPWHASLRCGEVNDGAFRELAKNNKWKRCPRCRYFVERIQGCKFIYCRCGVMFCYGCGRRVNGHSCSCVSPLSIIMEFVVPSVIILVLFFVMWMPVFIS